MAYYNYINIHYMNNNTNETDDVEIKTDRALTENLVCWEPDRTQLVKWTTEGMVNAIVSSRDVW